MKRTKNLRNGVKVAAAAGLAALLLAACGSSSTSTTTTTAASGGSSTTTTAATKSFLACEVTDTGGINDRSFNASAYQGLKVAAAAIPGLTYRFLSSQSTSDYAPNISQFLSDHCGIIVTVGYDMAAATYSAAKAHPSQKFTTVDYTYVKDESPSTPPLPNLLGLHYNTAQDAFLGGYLAAAMSKTGKVGTFGGQNIPTVTIYMDGWVAGVRYYDLHNHAHVTALGWTPQANRAKDSLNGAGLFTNDFTSLNLGETDAKTLMADGADIIFPVAGSVGLGAAAAVKAQGTGYYMEWVDTDGCVSAPQYCGLFITSVTKGIVASVSGAVEAAARGTFKGGNYNGDLANNGVSLSPYHDFASVIPKSVQTEITRLKAGIIAGTVSVDPDSYPSG
jgi:basic membrane protein A and related proteins